MRRLFSRALAACVLLPVVTAAQVRSFPYEAVVETDGTPVHSGPGGKFYETGRLKRGEKVVVHRHDPGGWYMVAPPAAEHSLIKADEIRKVGNGVAEVTIDEASVRVGSRVSDRHDVEQVPLARGDRVQIAAGVKAPAGWVAIRPPRGEYRWVPGQYVVPVPESARREQDADPFALPSIAKRPEVVPAAEVAAVVEPEGPQLSLSVPELPPKAAGGPAESLRRLDRELESLALKEPTDWPLDELTTGYRQLREAHPSAGRQIDVRLAQLERMRNVKRHYTDYVQLTSATDERDATLMAKQFEAAGPAVAAASPASRVPVKLGAPMQLPSGGEATSPLAQATPPVEPQVPAGPTLAAAGAPGRAVPGETGPESGPLLAPPGAPVAAAPRPGAAVAGAMPVQPAPGRPQPPVPGAPHRFDAVGVIQKAVEPHPEAPQHVLVAPNGRILAYLREQPGVPLDKFVGQPMGVDGQRHRHPELKTPMIVVERLTPVRF